MFIITLPRNDPNLSYSPSMWKYKVSFVDISISQAFGFIRGYINKFPN